MWTSPSRFTAPWACLISISSCSLGSSPAVWADATDGRADGEFIKLKEESPLTREVSPLLLMLVPLVASCEEERRRLAAAAPTLSSPVLMSPRRRD